MKLAVAGKGGVGKTTLVAILARLFAEEGDTVIAIDADPDANLASALGVPGEIEIVPVSRMKELIRERTGSTSEEYGKLFKLNPRVSDLPDQLAVEHAGIKIITMGGVRKGGGGCTCPENVFLKSLLTHLIVQRGETVIVDMEAGIEHLGRATVSAVDGLMVVIEPGRRSLQTAQQVRRLAEDIGIKRVFAVANKVKTEEQAKLLGRWLEDIPLLGCLSYSEKLAGADLEGRPAFESDPEAVAEVKAVKERLLGLLR